MILAERYQIIRPLAQGGFGKTFLACDRYLPGHPQCVIKQFLPTAITAENLETAQRLFNLEAETLYQLSAHPQIPTLLAHFEQAGEFYLVQEYIPGESLYEEFEAVLKQPLSLSARETYSYQLLQNLLEVLAFVHQNNVIHRDIKPANIIRRQSDHQSAHQSSYGQYGQLVLIDFGAVKAFSPQSDYRTAEPTVSIGSPGYIAPEQQAGRPCLASDLYAVGVIGLQALTRQAPKQQPIDPKTGQLRINEALPESKLVNFIKQLIQLSPADRYADANAALKVLAEIPCDRHSSSPPSSTPTAISSTAISPTVIPPSITGISSNQSLTAPYTDQYTAPRPTTQTTEFPPRSNVHHQGLPWLNAVTHSTETRNRQALLNKVNRFWIQGVLEQSLHGHVLLTLGLEERSQALALPWNISWETAAQPARPLDAGTKVFNIFQQLGEGRSLLILGEPGAGKTTTLLTLAKDLLAQWTTKQRIPAIFNLSSWTGGAVDQWLVSELNSKYQIPKSIGQTWVKEQQLLLLLDGLDEVRLDRRDSCAAAINQFHRDYGPELVVCCRMSDYEALAQKLAFQSALYVRSLTDQQIWQYLNQTKTELAGLRSLLERSAARQANQDGQALFDLARSPLILNIMALTYQGISASEIPAMSQEQSYTHQLFSAYIERMFQRRDVKRPYGKQQTLRWLRSLAINLTQTSQTVFLIERMQVNWLTSKRQRAAYITLVVGCFLLISTLIGWHVIRPQILPWALLVGTAICARIFGLYRIVPAEKLRWSWAKASRSLLLGITLGPLIGWALKFFFVFAFNPTHCVGLPGCYQRISLIGITFGIVLGITFGLIRGFSGDRIAVVTKPNQGIRQSAKNAIIFSLIATIAPWFTSLLFQGSTSPAFWAAAGLSFGLATGGGEACVKHGVLRFVLFCQGRIPWNYARFLNYAAERIFLQRVGGGYIFIHRLLLEHFASRPPVTKGR
ncbi:MAG: protein kinase [Phormidesmis sp.]